jgi:hypothetical protein
MTRIGQQCERMADQPARDLRRQQEQDEQQRGRQRASICPEPVIVIVGRAERLVGGQVRLARSHSGKRLL